METVEPESRLSQLGEKLQRLHPAGWMGKLLRWSGGEQGGDGVSGDGHAVDDSGEHEDESAEPATEQAGSKTEEFLALLPEGSELPEGFADEAAKLGLDLNGSKRAPYPAQALGSGTSFDPASLSLDWRLSAPPDSEVYKEAIENPKYSLDKSERETMKTIIDMGLPPYTD